MQALNFIHETLQPRLDSEMLAWHPERGMVRADVGKSNGHDPMGHGSKTSVLCYCVLTAEALGYRQCRAIFQIYHVHPCDDLSESEESPSQEPIRGVPRLQHDFTVLSRSPTRSDLARRHG